MMRFHNRWFLNIPHTTTQPSVAHYHHMFHPTLLRHWKGIEIHLLKQSPCLVKFIDNAASFVTILQQSKYLGICLSFICWGRLLSVVIRYFLKIIQVVYGGFIFLFFFVLVGRLKILHTRHVIINGTYFKCSKTTYFGMGKYF